jgi:hypothetical protein
VVAAVAAVAAAAANEAHLMVVEEGEEAAR